MMDDNKYGFPYGGTPYPRSNGGYPPQYPPQQRTPYPPVQQPQQGQMPGQGMDKMLEGTQILTGEGFKPLSKQEREEAARIAAEANFSFDGYQVVRREFFSHKFDPTLTIRSNGIIFNNACISKLDEVVYVQVLINPDTEELIFENHLQALALQICGYSSPYCCESFKLMCGFSYMGVNTCPHYLSGECTGHVDRETQFPEVVLDEHSNIRSGCTFDMCLKLQNVDIKDIDVGIARLITYDEMMAAVKKHLP